MPSARAEVPPRSEKMGSNPHFGAIWATSGPRHEVRLYIARVKGLFLRRNGTLHATYTYERSQMTGNTTLSTWRLGVTNRGANRPPIFRHAGLGGGGLRRPLFPQSATLTATIIHAWFTGGGQVIK